ncbi:MAG: zf-HC2 domain-containing protein, partial [Acidobacteria bacterium]|nr:zf-HC2 domain-containing protein [Acidobacteriota bacterium]
MKPQVTCLDDETLAAFIDGRLAAAERRAVVEHLADCESCYEVMEESLRLAQALAEEEGSERPRLTLVPDPDEEEATAEPRRPQSGTAEDDPTERSGESADPGSRRRQWFPPGWAYLAAAVVLVGVGLAFLWPQLRPRTLAGELAEAQLPDGWAVHEWNAVFRSGNSPEERVQAFRLGVHHQ